MREILFRGKDRFDGEWYVGSLTHDRKYGNCFIEICVHQGITKEVIPETVGQYVGLDDKNGKGIFEGDIVKVYDVYCNETVVGVVEFCDGSFRIYDKDFTSYDRWMYCKVEVIGNVYDDVNLLEA